MGDQSGPQRLSGSDRSGKELAGATGLEPATSGVTGRHSNQLSYAPAGDRALNVRGDGELRDAAGIVKKSGGYGGR